MGVLKKLKSGSDHQIPWAGPCGEGDNGGVTQSMLGRYLSCKERFRILVIEGLKPHPRFSAPMDFGTMWHACEEALAMGEKDHFARLERCVNRMMVWFPRDIESLLHWCSVAQELFPVYAEYWAEHPDVQSRTPILAEKVFDVPYTLPSGRVVRLRGKWDSVDLIGEGGVNKPGIYLQEDKTKSSIDRAKITRQLSFDLQTMVYLIALEAPEGLAVYATNGRHPIRGIRYNVVRRSAHKTTTSMMKKVREDMDEARVNEWFDRLIVEVFPADIAKFKKECLDPVLENLCDDYEWWSRCRAYGPYDDMTRARLFPDHLGRHFRMPYRGYDPLSEGGFGDVDAYMQDGSEVGLQRVSNLFPELTEV
jgi:hypothetical protein